MSIYENKQLLETRRDSPPGQQAEGVYAYARAADQYGAQAVIAMTGSKLSALADEGSYFIARNATPGTGLAGHAAPTAAPVVGTNDTKPFIVIRNTNAVSTKKRIYLDYIRVSVTAAGTGGTNLNYVLHLDSTTSTRYSSGTTNTLACKNANSDSSTTSGADVQVGPYVASAGSTTTGRILGGGLIRPVINVVGDNYLFTFGSPSNNVAGLITSGTAIANLVFNHGPVVIAPQHTLLFYLWSASQSAASSHEVEVAYYER